MNDPAFRCLPTQSNYTPQISMFFYMILLGSCVAGQKLISFFGLIISAGSLIFPISYMLVACITEVYGFRKSRKIIFMGAACNLIISAYLFLIIKIPHAPFWHNAESFSRTTFITATILLNSTVAYLVSEYMNAKVISKLKTLLNGRILLFRAIASTSTAAIIDSTFMLPIILKNSPEKVGTVFVSLILFKISYEIALLPSLWVLVDFLKRKESVQANKQIIPFSSVSYPFYKNNKK